MTAADDLACDLEERAGLIRWLVSSWQDLGYENPPTPRRASFGAGQPAWGKLQSRGQARTARTSR